MRARILGVSALATVLAIVLFGVPLALAVRQLYLDDERSELQRLALRAAVQVAPDYTKGVDAAELPAPEPETQLGLYDLRGVRISGTGPTAGDAATRHALTGQVAEDDDIGALVVAVPVGSKERVAAVVRAATPRAALTRRILLTWVVMALLALAALLAATALARWLAARLTRPLQQLASTATELGAGDFAARAEPSGIPEIDQAGQSLNRTAQRLGDLLARERSFSSHASHQLRTPLTGLRLTLDTALGAPPDQLRTAARAAIRAADRLDGTITDLLALARGPAPAAAPLDADALLADLREGWNGLFAAAGRPLRLRSQNPPLARGSRQSTRQVLDVLLDNAYHHGTGTVTVTARDAGAALALDVADEGPGMSLDAENADPPAGIGAGEGHGLGLPLARSLLDAQGGRLLLTQARPSAVFTVLLPLHSDER